MLRKLKAVARPAGVYVANRNRGLVCRTRQKWDTRFLQSREHLANQNGLTGSANFRPALTTSVRQHVMTEAHTTPENER